MFYFRKEGYEMPSKTIKQIHDNMSKIRNKDTAIELILRKALWKEGLHYQKNVSSIMGKPDIVFKGRKVAVFCDSEFWHGYNFEEHRKDFKSNQQFWIPKIQRNIERDLEVTLTLRDAGWTVIRFWGKDIKRDVGMCVKIIKKALIKEKNI